MYCLLRQLLFLLDPEISHDLSLELLSAAERLKILGMFSPKLMDDPVELMGLRFSNPVGLAAGLDKNGDHFNALGCLGFGFVEIGTITPKPQPGNPQPRLFRLADQEAIINRMGFNNKGVDYLVERVRRRRFHGVLGINIGKNKLTAEADALTDYQLAMAAVYPYADYITVNISSPNTPGLRNLQFGDKLKHLLAGLKQLQATLSQEQAAYKPLMVKIAPDMDAAAVKALCQTLANEGIDGLIATNTTLARAGVEGSPFADETGGLSGAPLADSATDIIQQVRAELSNMPIMGVGGIMQASDALAKLRAGANLVQIYSGFIYRGPQLIREARQAILESR